MRRTILAAFTLLSCSSGADPVRSASSCADCTEAGADDAAAAVDSPDETNAPPEASRGRFSILGDAAVVQIPTVNGDVCPVGVTDDVALPCFASDPAPYDAYLGPSGPTVGQCPKTTDFNKSRCAACGPIAPTAAAALDAGLESSCCYVVRSGCSP
jgi:hypothetical protein